MLTGDQFDRTRILALRLAGIELFDRHRDFVWQRMRRAGVGNASAIDALLSAAEQGVPEAERQFIGLTATRFTGFFRHPWHFDIAAEHALWAAQRRGRAQFWSAAASTGEEPYSLAMALVEIFGSDNPPATILATDIDESALGIAQGGEYGEPVLRAIDDVRRQRFFVATNVPGRWRVGPAVRRLVEFRAVNLAAATWQLAPPFDVIFCRNVLMYLETARREAALERMASLLLPGGTLILDPAEHVGSVRHLFTAGTNGVYSLGPSSLDPRHSIRSATVREI